MLPAPARQITSFTQPYELAAYSTAATMLPFHRSDESRASAAEKKHAASGNSKGKRLWRFFLDWLKVSWRDVLAMAILGAASQGVSPILAFSLLVLR